MGMNSRLSDTDKHVCDLEDIIMKIIPPPKKRWFEKNETI